MLLAGLTADGMPCSVTYADAWAASLEGARMDALLLHVTAQCAAAAWAAGALHGV